MGVNTHDPTTEVDRRPKPTAEGRSFYSYGYGYGGRMFRAKASAEGASEISMSDDKHCVLFMASRKYANM